MQALSLVARYVKPVVSVAAVLVTAMQLGCVSSGTYHRTKQDLEDVKRAHQAEQMRVGELVSQNHKQRERIAQLEGDLQKWKDQLTHTEKEWKEMRDNLLRFKIEREQERMGNRDRFKVESDRIDLYTDSGSKTRASSMDDMQRLKELKGVLQHLQTLLGP